MTTSPVIIERAVDPRNHSHSQNRCHKTDRPQFEDVADYLGLITAPDFDRVELYGFEVDMDGLVGMRWTEARVKAILPLRSFVLNERLNQICPKPAISLDWAKAA